jgi:hypothetical protein
VKTLNLNFQLMGTLNCFRDTHNQYCTQESKTSYVDKHKSDIY